jgi:hypothetical protein
MEGLVKHLLGFGKQEAPSDDSEEKIIDDMLGFITLSPPSDSDDEKSATSKESATKKATSDKVKLLSYNVLFKSFTMHEKKTNGENIINFLNEKKPDIMVLVEASPVIPHPLVGEEDVYKFINLDKYRKNVVFHGKKDSGGTMVYWSDKFAMPSQLDVTKGYERLMHEIWESDQLNYDPTSKYARIIVPAFSNTFFQTDSKQWHICDEKTHAIVQQYIRQRMANPAKKHPIEFERGRFRMKIEETTDGSLMQTNMKTDKQRLLKVGMLDSVGMSVYKRNLHANTSRPCVGVRLIHKTTQKSYIVIGVHYDHFVEVDMVVQALRGILLYLRYDGIEKVIVMGDHNEFFQHRLKAIKIDSIPTISTTFRLTKRDDEKPKTSLRKEPKLDKGANIIKPPVPNGTRVRPIGYPKDGFVLIRRDGGDDGYIQSKYLHVVVEPVDLVLPLCLTTSDELPYTCCGKPENAVDMRFSMKGAFDLVFSNVESLKMSPEPTSTTSEEDHSDYSDHLPLVGSLSVGP